MFYSYANFIILIKFQFKNLCEIYFLLESEENYDNEYKLSFFLLVGNQ